MTTYEYQIQEQDFIDFQLYTASKSESIRRKKRNGWIGLTLGSAVLGIWCFWVDARSMAIYFGLVAVLVLLFYPTYFMWRYKRHYEKYINTNYKGRFGETVIAEIHPDHIFTKDRTGEGKIYLSGIDHISETPKHLFASISSGMSLIFPKENINSQQLKEEFAAAKIPIHDELDWKWKL